VIADLAAIDDNVKQEALPIFENTLVQAQKYNLQMQKVVPQGMTMPPGRRPSGFLNDYYDDEGWWVLAW
jgi:hypothetical protein